MGMLDKMGAKYGLPDFFAGGPVGYMAPDDAALFAQAPPMVGGGIPRISSAPRRPVPGPLQPTPSPPQSGDGKGKAPAQRGGIGGFFDRLGHGIGDMARSGELSMRLSAMQAEQAGQPGVAAQIMQNVAALRAQREAARQAGEVRQSFANDLMKQGMSAGDVEIALQNPQAFAQEWATRMRTRDLNPSQTVLQPELNGSITSTTLPPLVDQQARAAGLTPGTPQYNTFIQDAVLNAQGPTGTATTRRGQDITERDSIRSNQTSRANNADTNATSRANNAATVGGANYRHTTPGAGTVHPPTPATVIGAIMAQQAAGQPLTPTQQQLLNQYQAGRGHGRGGQTATEGQIITNPTTGERRQLRGGQWVPIR